MKFLNIYTKLIIFLCQTLTPLHSYIYIKNQTPYSIRVNTYITLRSNLTNSYDLTEIVIDKFAEKIENMIEYGVKTQLVSVGLVRSQSSSFFRYDYDDCVLCLIKIVFPNGHFFFIRSIRDEDLYTVSINEEGKVFIKFDSSDSSSESPTIEEEDKI